MLGAIEYLFIALAGLAAGAINALAGGGTLITYPVLTAVGIPPVAANVTSTVALWPGYLGATIAQARDLAGQSSRMRFILPAAALGGIVGGILLLNTDDRLFSALVPFLILMAAALLAGQDPVRAWVLRRSGQTASSAGAEKWAAIPVFLAAIYGGYFGAGLSVIVLAVLGVAIDDSLTRLNALKQAVSLSVNMAAATFFIFSGGAVWSAALVLAGGALAGGVIGGRLAGRIEPAKLRWTVVTIGVLVAVIYLVR